MRFIGVSALAFISSPLDTTINVTVTADAHENVAERRVASSCNCFSSCS